MKGTPQEPRCGEYRASSPYPLSQIFPSPSTGFSRQVIGLLDGIGADYSTFNILSDEEVRQGEGVCVCFERDSLMDVLLGLKKYSNWPTFPQLYVNGELVGGLDILKVRSLPSHSVLLLQ